MGKEKLLISMEIVLMASGEMGRCKGQEYGRLKKSNFTLDNGKIIKCKATEL